MLQDYIPLCRARLTGRCILGRSCITFIATMIPLWLLPPCVHVATAQSHLLRCLPESGALYIWNDDVAELLNCVQSLNPDPVATIQDRIQVRLEDEGLSILDRRQYAAFGRVIDFAIDRRLLDGPCAIAIVGDKPENAEWIVAAQTLGDREAIEDFILSISGAFTVEMVRYNSAGIIHQDRFPKASIVARSVLDFNAR